MMITVGGIHVYQGALSVDQQAQLADQVREVVRLAPLFRPETRTGRAMSVRITSAGRVGWISDRKGYRYEPRHPGGMAWPKIPDIAQRVWHDYSSVDCAPQSCLINFYDADAKMGLHQDRDETDLSKPVVSISLGDDALFRVGGRQRGGPTESLWLSSGDVAVMGGDARLNYHGIDRIRPGSSTLLPKGGRINLTLRVVN